MKLLIIGHSVVDHIFDGTKEKVSPGGIFYSAAGFNAVKSKDDELYLLTSQSDDAKNYFKEIFRHFNLDFVNEVKSVPHVNLYVDGIGERREHYEHFTENLDVADEIKLNEFDGIYINMISGQDLSADQFIQLRQNYNGKIFLDVHTLSRGIRKDQHRFFRKIEDYQTYLNSVDVVQVNENELLTITPHNILPDILEEVFEIGVSILIITKGKDGAEIYTSSGEKFSVDAIKVKSINKVGCGDVFGSVFFYSYISGQSIMEALILANSAAGLTTTFGTTKELIKMNYDLIKGYIEN